MSDFTPSFDARLNELHNNIKVAQNELEKLRLVYGRFPLISYSAGANGKGLYFSTEVNPVADTFSANFGGHIEIIPFIHYNGFDIHTDPVVISINTTMTSDGQLVFIDSLEEKLSEHNINPDLILKIKEKLLSNNDGSK